ncbi:CaiB/BaiF CoA-transferase family protein [Bordetella sp. BOR01]|uniref:CaiB/BaiF CoA transferase family protein n=1 Tax=Bordetella sp. BOR01 TaxID=2854779 RepID=UPI001C449600|nr:CaiB/BaiF CoA-transferase family protein [Bordetella sp. BOR01]MBV7483332.1 CoA transferase [Bordetella sp. BOR01]
MQSLPLEGVVVLDLSRQLPGPVSTQILADFGADVIKIEDTHNGDDFRRVEPHLNGVSARHMMINRNKRGLAINLKSPEGRAIFLDLAKRSDVVFEQFRPGVVQRLGIDYEAVRAVNPKIVYCALSGFGQHGPLRDVVAHDPNYLSISGILGLMGRRDGPPAMSGPQISDLAAANMATIGILLALRGAERTGLGEYIDIALFDSAFSLAITALSTYVGSGTAPSRGEERHNGRYPWSDIYETADGGFITLSAIEPHFYRNLCEALGRPEWSELQYADDGQQERIRVELRNIFMTRTRDEWFERLKDKEVCISPVLTVAEAARSEQVQSRQCLVPHCHPVAGDTHLLSTPIRMMHAPAAIRRHAPALGEHSAEILASLGLDAERIADLHTRGIVLVPPAALPQRERPVG